VKRIPAYGSAVWDSAPAARTWDAVVPAIDRAFAIGATPQVIVERFGIELSLARKRFGEWRQKEGAPEKHHPVEKANQIKRILAGARGLSIYETHGGHGYCTRIYKKFGTVTSRTHADGDDLDVTYAELASGRRYDVVDIDPYGFPSRLLAIGAIRLVRPGGRLFLTFPAPNGFRGGHPSVRTHLRVFYKSRDAGEMHYAEYVERQARIHDYTIRVVERIRMGGVIRFVFGTARAGLRARTEIDPDQILSEPE